MKFTLKETVSLPHVKGYRKKYLKKYIDYVVSNIKRDKFMLGITDFDIIYIIEDKISKIIINGEVLNNEQEMYDRSFEFIVVVSDTSYKVYKLYNVE